MDWKLLGTTFVTVFVAELGDKTQLATMALAAAPGARWAVFVGASLALVATSALGVLAGELVGRYVSPIWVHRGAGALFLVLGTLLIVRGE